MKDVMWGAFLASAALVAWSPLSFASDLSVEQKKELIVFGLRSMGIQAGIGDVKEVLSKPEIEQIVATGISTYAPR